LAERFENVRLDFIAIFVSVCLFEEEVLDDGRDDQKHKKGNSGDKKEECHEIIRDAMHSLLQN
jgi:hypothetical protein